MTGIYHNQKRVADNHFENFREQKLGSYGHTTTIITLFHPHPQVGLERTCHHSGHVLNDNFPITILKHIFLEPRTVQFLCYSSLE